jgi:hypothetical protein
LFIEFVERGLGVCLKTPQAPNSVHCRSVFCAAFFFLFLFFPCSILKAEF